MSLQKVLVSGSRSGLGRYLHDYFNGDGLDRTTSIEKFAKGVYIIIHCAVNRAKEVTSDNLYEYIYDNVLLTERLIKIPHKKFIYISTVDVYPESQKKHLEQENIDIKNVSSIYGQTKLMSESIVQNLSKNFLILRCTSLLGREMKENSLVKIIKEKNPTLTLRANSQFNYIFHSQVADFIKYSIERDVLGIYNLASSKNVTLGKAASLLKKKVRFGNYSYNVGKISNKKISSIFPEFKKTSEEIIREFAKVY